MNHRSPLRQPDLRSRARADKLGARTSVVLGRASAPHRTACGLAASLALACCTDSTGPAWPRIEETDFAPSLGVELSDMMRRGGGLYVQDLELGSGARLDGSRPEVVISYALRLADGTLVEQREGFRFEMGCFHVVRGLDVGIDGMNAGGTRRIVVPPRLGYFEGRWGVHALFGEILVYVVEAISSSPVRDPCLRGPS